MYAIRSYYGVEEEFVIATGGILTQTAAIKTIRDTIEENAIVVVITSYSIHYTKLYDL